jgi:hypothetical protein
MAEKKHYPLRIDKKIFNAIELWAADELRSVNSHIEYLLKEALTRAGRAGALKKEETGEDK